MKKLFFSSEKTTHRQVEVEKGLNQLRIFSGLLTLIYTYEI